MASPLVLDFDQLLAPIAGDSPTGPNLREDRVPLSPYQVMRSARTQARTAERQALNEEPGTEVKIDWKPVLEQGPRILANKSKDVEVTAWFTEALVRKHGFPGVRDGFKLAREMVERFWDNLHPMPNEDGMINRVAALAGLNGIDGEGTLIGPINNIALTEGKSVGPFNRGHYKQAAELEGMADPDRRAARLARGAVSLGVFQKAAAETSTEFYRNLLDDVDQCLVEFAALTEALDTRCGNGPDGMPVAPPSSNIRNALEACRDIILSVARDRLGLNEVASEGTMTNEQGQSSGGGGGSGPIRNRNDAFQTLLRVATFFKDTEPHSPVSYALEQAVRWGRMPLPDLLSELIPDQAARDNVYKRVGIEIPIPPA